MFRYVWQAIKRLQWIIYLHLITFFIVLPLLCHRRVFTVYFRTDESTVKKMVYHDNDIRIKASYNYLNSLNPNVTRNLYEKRLTDENLELIVTLITVRREFGSKKFHFPLQVAAEFDKQIRLNPLTRVALIVCNVDSEPSKHADALYLSSYFPSATRTTVSRVDKYQKEKDDYAFCLEKSLNYNSTFVLILEDDSIPRRQMLPYLKHIIDNKIKFKIRHGEHSPNPEQYLAVKLYYPLRWSGFGFEFLKLLELLAIGCVGAGVFALLASVASMWIKLIPNTLAISGACYSILLALVLQRPNLMELRWFHPSLFRVVDAPGCCTQAMMYIRSEIESLIQFLNRTNCSADFAVDLAIDSYSQSKGLAVYMVEPNLFHHVGFYSSLTKSMKTPVEEFLFN